MYLAAPSSIFLAETEIEERNAFRQVWQKRIQNMTQEERQTYLGSPQGTGQGQMQRGSGNAPCGAGRGRGGGR